MAIAEPAEIQVSGFADGDYWAVARNRTDQQRLQTVIEELIAKKTLVASSDDRDTHGAVAFRLGDILAQFATAIRRAQPDTADGWLRIALESWLSAETRKVEQA
jgi:hypothetical protein